MKDYDSYKEKFDEIEELKRKAEECNNKARIMEEEVIRKMIEDRGLQNIVVHKESGKEGILNITRLGGDIRIRFHGLKKDRTPSKNCDSYLSEWMFFPSEKRISKYLSEFEPLSPES